MNPISKLYVKTFLYTGIPYGLLMTIFDFVDGNEFSIWKFLFSTLFFGITMSLILVSYHKNRLKKNGIQEINVDNIGVNQSRFFETRFNKVELIQKLKADPIIGKMKIKEIENGIFLTTGITWKSWGEEIKIILKSEKDNNFQYLISSNPKLKITLIDYGKNLENINLIENVIKTFA